MDNKTVEEEPESQRKPWQIRYILLAILIFAAIFNAWLFFGGGS
ncbi:hypothetical protein [Rubellicoccus peritrichatus]|uniref:Uncharacterized protein n=1 Tax=Rubellicoccus peritrichatus TaxID=3080537 RepID=A0AAQ3QXA5_9BACT|nr:hypothetical protein [Puniceicoccus sp. CR14]WOO42827.1 hypothetical protein RZN69_06960 [Puniceicoccus sp. CR14]